MASPIGDHSRLLAITPRPLTGDHASVRFFTLTGRLGSSPDERVRRGCAAVLRVAQDRCWKLKETSMTSDDSSVSFISNGARITAVRTSVEGVKMEACLTPANADQRRMPIAPAKRDVASVARLRRFMDEQHVSSHKRASLVSPDGAQLEIPTSIYKVLVAAVAAMAQGNAVSIIPVHHELTTQQAADLLNVSRPHLVKLLGDGAIPFHKTGAHRRIYFEDLMRFRDLRDAERQKALRDLTQKSAEYGLDY
jgi:excisionase family DNA binding protein